MFKKNQTESDLDRAIESVLFAMTGHAPDSKEYAAMSTQLKKLYKLKAIDKPQSVSPDTWALVIANLVGIGIIVWHERANVVTTKAIGLLRKTI